MHHVVFLDRDTIAPAVVVRRPSFPHTWTEYARTAAADVFERAKDATILILNKVEMRAAMLDRLPKLKLIAVAATGTDCVDVAAAAARGIPTVNIRGYAKATVPEHTFALILALARSLVPYRASVLAGRWQEAAQFCYFDFPAIDLAGRRLGIVGGGVLGGRVAEIGRVFGMDVVIHDPKSPRPILELVSFEELIETSDLITLHCPLTAETRGFIGIEQFRRMKKKPILVNTARGGLVVEEDLHAALTEGLIAGAGFDVTLPEPPPRDGIFMKIAALPNVIVTPHTAWASIEAQQTLTDQLIDNVENFVAGRPTNVVG